MYRLLLQYIHQILNHRLFYSVLSVMVQKITWNRAEMLLNTEQLCNKGTIIVTV